MAHTFNPYAVWINEKELTKLATVVRDQLVLLDNERAAYLATTLATSARQATIAQHRAEAMAMLLGGGWPSESAA